MNNHHELPPTARTSIWRKITEAAESGEFMLQVCKQCESVQYPPRELCGNCLHDALEWEKISAKGRLISHTELHASTNAFFREHLPLQVALVKLECGAILFVHIAHDEIKTGDAVTILNRRDVSGEGVFVAIIDASDEQIQLTRLNSILLQDN